MSRLQTYPANPNIASPRVLGADERATVIAQARHRGIPVAEIARHAGIRYRVHGGIQPLVVIWDGPGHGKTRDDDGRPVYAVEHSAIPIHEPERSVRILEILAYGFFDYGARESIIGRGIFSTDHLRGSHRSERRR